MVATRREIPIERVREVLSYDANTGKLIWERQLGRNRVGDDAGCLSSSGYLLLGIDKRLYKAHRIAWALHYGEQPPDYIDHVNGDGSDNRICNLRECTQTQNNQNNAPRKSRLKASSYKGVSLWRLGKWSKWYARIVVNKKSITLGYFDTEEEAAEAYRKAATEHFGQFARIG